jgi:hypothetical protein
VEKPNPTQDFAHTHRGPWIAGRSRNGFAVSWLPLSVALAALIAVIGAKRARRSPEGRFEARGRPCPHDACAGGLDRAGFMKDARGRWRTAISARDED